MSDETRNDEPRNGGDGVVERHIDVMRTLYPEMLEPTDAMREEAVQWLVRLREPAAPPVHADFEAWKTRNPAHEFALAEMEALFEDIGPVAAELAERDRIRERDTEHEREREWDHEREREREREVHTPAILTRLVGRPRVWIAAACLALAILIGVISQHDRFFNEPADASTVAGATEQLRLADGSQITLNTRTAIKVMFELDRRAVRLLHGEAYFDVAKDAERPFLVHAGNARVRVMGTKFNVRVDDDQVVVTVDEGTVRLAPAAAPERAIDLTAGQQALLDAAAVQRQKSYDATAISAWRRRQVVFYGASLAEVVNELNRYRSTPIIVLGGALRARKVSGVFNVTDTDSAVRTVKRTLSVRTMRIGGVTLIY